MNLYKVNYDTYIAADTLFVMEHIFKVKYPTASINKIEVVSENLLTGYSDISGQINTGLGKPHL